MKNAQKLLEKISQKNITPIPKWHFVLKNIFFWGIGILFILFGIVAFSLLLDQIFETDTEMLSHISPSPVSFILEIIPFFWIFFAALFLGVAYFGMSHTKKGYKYSLLQIWGISIGISFLLGSGVYASGYAEHIEEKVAHYVHFYHSNEDRRKDLWSHPRKGFISGEIIAIFPQKKTLLLKNWKEEEIGIIYQEADIKTHQQNNFLKKDEKIKIIGSLSPNNTKLFIATEIRPWEGQRKHGKFYHIENQ